MIDYKYVYDNQAAEYDLMVSKEDWQHNLLKTISDIIPLNNISIAEFGAGTGRLSFILADHAAMIHAFDRNENMIAQAIKKQNKRHVSNISFSVAEHFSIPLTDNFADCAVEGWAFWAMKHYNSGTLIELYKKAIAEMERVVKKSAPVILIETLGTCVDEPKEKFMLMEVNQWLEKEMHFHLEIIKTDYCFESVDEAVKLMGMFFNEPEIEYIKKKNSTIIPEYTGVWWKCK